MSTGDEKESPVSQLIDRSARWERWGLTAFLLACAFCVRPYIEKLYDDHREFLKTTSGALVEQTKLMGASADRLDRLDAHTERNGELLRDIHGRVIHSGTARDGSAVVDK